MVHMNPLKLVGYGLLFTVVVGTPAFAQQTWNFAPGSSYANWPDVSPNTSTYVPPRPIPQPDPGIPPDAYAPPPMTEPVRAQRGSFYLRADAFTLKRDNQHANVPPVPLVLQGAANNAVLIDTSMLHFKQELGQRLTAGYAWERTALEFTFWQVQNWISTDNATGNNNLRIPGDLALATLDFFDADFMRTQNKTMIRNMEANLLQTTIFEKFSFLGGFRYFNLRDQFDIQSTDLNSGTSDYVVTCQNRLYGGQIGVLFKQNFDLFTFEFVGKTGAFDNSASEHNYLGDFNNQFTLRDVFSGGHNLAFVGEIGLTGAYRLSNFLVVRGGYQLIWVDRVALGEYNLDFTDTATSGTTLQHSGNLFFHGANLGLEARF